MSGSGDEVSRVGLLANGTTITILDSLCSYAETHLLHNNFRGFKLRASSS